MSDILIKNMEMPENCLHCGFSHMASDCLKIWIICKPKDISVTDGDAVKEGRPDWCPLVEVPPHGRLIDADALSEKHGDWYTEEGTEEGFIGTLKYLIAEQPTIIESDGKDINVTTKDGGT